jgi:hypothetical protein
MKTRCSNLVRFLSALVRPGNTPPRIATSVMLAAGIFTAPLQAQIVFDATAEFSITNGNPNGVWSYGWMPTDFSLFTYLTNAKTSSTGSQGWSGWNNDDTPGVGKIFGGEAYGVPSGWLSLHPGPGEEPSVLRWTSPFYGLVRIQGRFLPGDSGTMQVAVRTGGQTLWQAVDSGPFDLLKSVLPGDTVDLIVYGGYFYGNTPLEANISLTPVESAILLRRGLVTVAESANVVLVEVLCFRPEHLNEEVAVDYATADETAHAGQDYVAASGTLHFAVGETNKQIAITILNDALKEPEEQFHLVLSNPTAGVPLGNSNVVIRIQSDEPMMYYVNVNNPNPVFPYINWATAATNIQDAVDLAKAGDTVLVTNGVYASGVRDYSRVVITNAIRLESVNGPLVTTIVGSTVVTNEFGEEVGREGGRCVYLGANAVLSGFTLTNGFASVFYSGGWGGGVLSEPSGMVTNCTLTGNVAAGFTMIHGSLGLGGGANGGTLYNCTLVGNSVDSNGGGGGAWGSTL